MLQDLKYALRQLRKSPGFTLTAVLTLALGTGVTAAVFSVIYAVMIQPLPYEHPERIVVPQTYSPQGYTPPASYPEYLDWRMQSHSFSAFAAASSFGRINLEGPSGPVSLRLTQGSDNLFDVFDVLQRIVFVQDEDRAALDAQVFDQRAVTLAKRSAAMVGEHPDVLDPKTSTPPFLREREIHADGVDAYIR